MARKSSELLQECVEMQPMVSKRVSQEELWLVLQERRGNAMHRARSSLDCYTWKLGLLQWEAWTITR